jgi:PIN domain nuclease of toxin-antitoxin system
MRVLLDTHVFLWWLAGDTRLPVRAREILGDPLVVGLVSAASAWEISTKVRIGKLPGIEAISDDIGAAIASQGFEELPIRVQHAERAGKLPGLHRDPFDRLLAAQAQLEGVSILSVDPIFDAFGVPRIG